jgi:hypothetical protein
LVRKVVGMVVVVVDIQVLVRIQDGMVVVHIQVLVRKVLDKQDGKPDVVADSNYPHTDRRRSSCRGFDRPSRMLLRIA